jgi:toxin-antitoxin system PIN domain toxin
MWTNSYRMNVSLPDVNIWIALAAEGHSHHVPARDWFAAQPDASVAFCRITQMGLLRLLTNPNVMGRAPRTVVQAWDIYAQLGADRRLVFATEPDSIEYGWRRLMTQAGVGPSSWTDAYLAAFAETHSYSLVTFDTAFKRWSGLELTLLSPTRGLSGQ